MVADLYLAVATKPGAGNVGPRDEDQFRRSVKALSPELREAYALDPADPESVLISLRDGQPFVLVPGVPVERLSPSDGPIVAYEKNGESGRRLVARLNGSVEELSDAELERQLKR